MAETDTKKNFSGARAIIDIPMFAKRNRKEKQKRKRTTVDDEDDDEEKIVIEAPSNYKKKINTFTVRSRGGMAVIFFNWG